MTGQDARKPCDVCGSDSDDSAEYRTPTHNGVYAEPERIRMCGTCAYLLADHISEWAAQMRGGQ